MEIAINAPLAPSTPPAIASLPDMLLKKNFRLAKKITCQISYRKLILVWNETFYVDDLRRQLCLEDET
jgi:hypothetical protein